MSLDGVKVNKIFINLKNKYDRCFNIVIQKKM